MARTDRQAELAEKDRDVALMLRVRDGDEEAFAELVRRNVRHVHALVYRFLREGSEVDDITQDVFLRIYRNAGNYQPTAKFSTWLYRIVANMCFNVMRSRKNRRQVSLDAGRDDDRYHDLPDEQVSMPTDRLDREELARHVAEAIEKLPDQQKAAIILNRYQNKNYAEIAEVLDTTTMAVKSLLSRARTNLRQHLRRYGPND